MQFNTFAASLSDLEHCAQAPNLQEVLLEPVLLARQGRLSPEQTQSLALAATKRELKPVLVWDALMPERLMQPTCNQLKTWDLTHFQAIRVCDPGVAWWVKTHLPQIPIQLIVEAGNHNLAALQGWCDLFQGSLERLVLSIELTEQKLMEYCQTLPVGCEVLGVGQILLFYSPRSLLLNHLQAPHFDQSEPNQERYLEATVASEESGNRPFPTVETHHGTLMFLDKDQFILDQLAPLKLSGLHSIRLDLRHLGQGYDVAMNIDQICQQILDNPVDLRKNWPRPTRSPFFKANRTTSIFPRIRSRGKLADYRQQDECLAEVLSGESGKYVVFQSLQAFAMEQAQSLMLPTGETVSIPADLIFKMLNHEAVTRCDRDQLLVTDWIKKAVPGSLLMAQRLAESS
ncbi:MAG: U32 family peptidase [Microcoleaceae cyanobacterium]